MSRLKVWEIFRGRKRSVTSEDAPSLGHIRWWYENFIFQYYKFANRGGGGGTFCGIPPSHSCLSRKMNRRVKEKRERGGSHVFIVIFTWCLKQILLHRHISSTPPVTSQSHSLWMHVLKKLNSCYPESGWRSGSYKRSMLFTLWQARSLLITGKQAQRRVPSRFELFRVETAESRCGRSNTCIEWSLNGRNISTSWNAS